MSQFQIYKNTGRNCDSIPYVLDVQSDLVSLGLSTRIVVPLYDQKEITSPALRIHVPVNVKRKKTIALFDEMSAVPLQRLGKAYSKASEDEAVSCKKALDCIFFGIP